MQYYYISWSPLSTQNQLHDEPEQYLLEHMYIIVMSLRLAGAESIPVMVISKRLVYSLKQIGKLSTKSLYLCRYESVCTTDVYCNTTIHQFLVCHLVIKRERARKSETERDTERHRETQRDTERHRETQRDTERHRETQRDTERDRERQREAERQKTWLHT
jgi:hypothetical protein